LRMGCCFMWVELGAGQGSVVHFYAIPTSEASLHFVLEAMAGNMALFYIHVLLFVHLRQYTGNPQCVS
jgi:hypothetical protein